MISQGNRDLILPAWMKDDSSLPVWKEPLVRQGHNFLSKSIREMKRALAEGLLTEEYASRKGQLQKINPRQKLLAALALLVAIGLVRNMFFFAVLWLVSILLMQASNLPTLRLQKRIWLFIPLVTLLISLPAMLNFFIAGTPLIWIRHGFAPAIWCGITLPADIYISQQGFRAGIILFLRVGLSLSIGVLLAMTTPMAGLFKSLRILGLPTVVIMIIEMCYRYLVLTLNLSIEMFEARSLRTVGFLSITSRREQVGSSIAALFARSLSLADEVYMAMVARGYTGQPVTLDEKMP